MSEEIPTLLETGDLVQILFTDETLLHVQMQSTTEIGIYFWARDNKPVCLHFVPWHQVREIAQESMGPIIKNPDNSHPIDKLLEVIQWLRSRTHYVFSAPNDLQVRRMAAAERDVFRAYETLNGVYDATLKP